MMTRYDCATCTTAEAEGRPVVQVDNPESDE